MKRHKQICAMTLATIQFHQISKIDSDELGDILVSIAMDFLLYTDALQEDIDFDDRFYLKRYFTKYPTPKFERLLQEWKERNGSCWYHL